MSLLDKMIEKIGIVDEEYDEEEEVVEQDADLKGNEESVPPEFLQHVSKKTVSFTKHDEESKKGETPAFKPVEKPVLKLKVKPVVKPVEKKAEPEKKGGFFGLKCKEKQEMNPVTALAKALHVVIVRPESFDDSQQIAEYLKREQSVIVNYEKTDEVVTARINDFVCGVVYAVGGTVQKIDQKSMFCAPKMVDVDNKEGVSE